MRFFSLSSHAAPINPALFITLPRYLVLAGDIFKFSKYSPPLPTLSCAKWLLISSCTHAAVKFDWAVRPTAVRPRRFTGA